MRFSVLAVTAVPDLVGARRRDNLQGLDDQAVTKVLFHQRKQMSGRADTLRWDQCALGAATLIAHSGDELRIQEMTAGTHGEPAMLEMIAAAGGEAQLLLTWQAESEVLPLLRYRAAIVRCQVPGIWTSVPGDDAGWQDLQDWWSAEVDERPGLDALARGLALPGSLGYTETAALDEWLSGDESAAQARASLRALNLYLVVLRILRTSGDLTGEQLSTSETRLSGWLAAQPAAALAEFHMAWRDTG